MNKRSGFLATGIVVLIVGLLVAAGLWYSAGQREADAVRNLARAPAGCETVLDFDVAGEFLIFIETDGRTRSVEGDCNGDVTSFGQVGLPQDLPPVRLTLTDSSGSTVALDARAGIGYDADGSAGQVVRSFVIDAPGDHTLRVESVDDAGPPLFQVAVGQDPSDGVSPLRLGAIAAGLVGAIIGIGLIVAGRRRSEVAVPAVADPWATHNVPTSPPGMPQAPPPAAHTVPPGPPTVPPTEPGGQVGPSTWQPTAPPISSGAAGDGERSPWAPPGSTD